MQYFGTSKERIKTENSGDLIPHDQASIGIGERTINASVFSLRKNVITTDVTHVLRIVIGKDVFRLYVPDPAMLREFTDYLHKFVIDASRKAEDYVTDITKGHVTPKHKRKSKKHETQSTTNNGHSETTKVSETGTV